MGQYWQPVNLDKKEYVSPHRLGSGLKLWEQLAAHPGTGAALTILCAAMPEARGGGDFDLDENWHGPERKFPEHSITPGPMPEAYAAIARRTIGRWAGDRIALVGDYAEPGDVPGYEDDASLIYGLCYPEQEDGGEPWTDVTDDVAAVIEHELGGHFVGQGWRSFVRGTVDPERRCPVCRAPLIVDGDDLGCSADQHHYSKVGGVETVRR
ncbi:MAG: hypothetical protein LC798_13675 [Chloroflexi bacterium]|nr:hypothetical protein [Chloroflexota bacterium]